MEHEEYTVKNYPCCGKKYNGEKAIISLTSWKARINTVSKTLFSLIQQCPGFHIVLCLSEEEFPERENELPENLMLFVNNELVEILWVYKNYKAFKKILFTMDKYRDVPVISADDDCIYTSNYAQMLYDKWLENKDNIISMGSGSEGKNGYYSFFGENKINQKQPWPTGSKSLYPPYIFKHYGLKLLNDTIISTNNDDGFYGYIIFHILNKTIINPFTQEQCKVYYFHDEFEPMHNLPAYNLKKALLVISNELYNIKL